MTIFNEKVPEKCEASPDFKCDNADKTLEELGVFYVSMLPTPEKDKEKPVQEELVCLCENCHTKHGLGKFESKIPLGQRYELQEGGKWKLIEVDIDENELAEMEESVKKDFWQKVKGLIKDFPFVKTAVACYYCSIDKKTPIYVKASLVAPLVYFINPIDLVPDLIPILGLLDDAGVIYATAKLFGDSLKEEHWTAADHFFEGEPQEGCDCPYCASF